LVLGVYSFNNGGKWSFEEEEEVETEVEASLLSVVVDQGGEGRERGGTKGVQEANKSCCCPMRANGEISFT